MAAEFILSQRDFSPCDILTEQATTLLPDLDGLVAVWAWVECVREDSCECDE
jgi:hypothetical protein